MDPLPLPQKGGRGAKGGSPLVAATLWWEGRGTGGLGNCTRVFSPPLAASGPTPRLQENLLGCRQRFPRWEMPWQPPLAHGQAPRGCVTAAKRRGWLPRRWCGHVAKDGSVTYKLVYTHGERKGGGCGSISRVSRGSIIVFSLAVRTRQRGQYPLPLGPGLCPSRPRPPLPLPPPSSCPRCRASQLSILSVYETGPRPMESLGPAASVKIVAPVPSTAPPPLVLTPAEEIN